MAEERKSRRRFGQVGGDAVTRAVCGTNSRMQHRVPWQMCCRSALSRVDAQALRAGDPQHPVEPPRDSAGLGAVQLQGLRQRLPAGHER